MSEPLTTDDERAAWEALTASQGWKQLITLANAEYSSKAVLGRIVQAVAKERAGDAEAEDMHVRVEAGKQGAIEWLLSQPAKRMHALERQAELAHTAAAETTPRRGGYR